MPYSKRMNLLKVKSNFNFRKLQSCYCKVVIFRLIKILTPDITPRSDQYPK